MAEVLRRLSTSNCIHFAVISGRALSDMARQVPAQTTVAGNHGLEIRGNGFAFEHPGARELRPCLALLCSALSEAVRPWPGAWVEDKGLSATVHYRKVSPQQQSSVLMAARRCAGTFGGKFALRSGKKALEVRPNISWDKGQALNYIRDQAGPFDMCICLGDDRTDETMFRANPEQFNIKVGLTQPTDASYHLSDPGEVAVFLSHVFDVCERGAWLPSNTGAVLSAAAQIK